MSTAKEQFLKNKDLVRWWVSVAHDSRFADVMTHARSALIEHEPERTELHGVAKFVSILETLSDSPIDQFDFPSPGMIHNVDRMPERVMEATTPPPPPSTPPLKRTKKR